MKVLCMGGRTVGPEVPWDLVRAYLAAKYSWEERHLRRLGEDGDPGKYRQTKVVKY